MRGTFAAPADDVDDARHGVRTVKRALRPACDFHAVHPVDGERREVEVAAELVDLDAVDHDQVIVGVAPADENARRAAAPARLVDFNTGDSAQHVEDALGAPVLDFGLIDDADRGPDLRRERAHERSRHHHALVDGADFEAQVRRCRCRVADL